MNHTFAVIRGLFLCVLIRFHSAGPLRKNVPIGNPLVREPATRKFASALIASLLTLLTSASLHAATVPGTILGSFGVSETGAATYSIPIAVPPGTAGMEPKLSFNYSSQGGNGIAGVGWSLGGLSAITRCPQTIIQDGQTRGVQLDANDRFCLDGQRLIAINGATYGAIGAEYRTEIESFSKVVSYGGTAGDPQYFKIWTKAGQIIEFGNTTDSRLEAQGKTIAAAWAVNKISDTAGNYIAFTYFEDNANGEHRITRIDYTGNAAASVSPYNTVEFQYETRPDPSSGYLAGSLNQQTQRLLHILTRTGGAPVMDYGLNYEIGTTTGRSRLSSLTQCAATGDCLNPTTFGWQEGEAASFDTAAIESSMPGGSTSDVWFAMGDMNGDGRSDALVAAFSRWNFEPYTGQQDGSFTPGTITAIPGTPYVPPGFLRLLLSDVNGDGKADPSMCGIDAGYGDLSGNWYLWGLTAWTTNDLNGTTPFSPLIHQDFSYESQYYGQITANREWCIPADINADGKADFVPYLSNRKTGVTPNLPNELWSILVNGSSALQGGVVYVDDATRSDISFFQLADINGDGYPDAIRYDPTYPPNSARNGELRVWKSIGIRTDGIPFATPPISQIIDAGGSPADRWFTVADVNGDGLGDMVLHTPADGKLKVWLSKGDGMVTAKYETTGFSTGGTPSDTWFLMVDVNGDGRADAVKYTPSSGNIVFAISYGDGTFGMPVNASLSSGYTYTPPATSGGGGSRSIAGVIQQIIATGFNPTPTIGPSPTTAWFQPADVNGDGVLDWVIYHPGEGKIKVNLGQGAIPDLLLTITDGHGATRNIAYKPLTDPSVYTKGTGATYPVQDVQNTTYVVSETAADDGIGGSFRNAYRYAGARTHLTGRGFLGFATLEQTDLQTGIVTRTNYRQDFPYIGQPVLVTKTSSGGVELNRVENTYAVKAIPGGGQFPYLAYSKEQGKDLNAAILPSTETWNTYGDDWGNLTQVITQVSDGFKKQTDNTYTNDAAKWFLGRLTRASVASTINSSWTLTRVSAFEYDATTGLLDKEILEPDQPQLRLDTAYAFDAFGNRKTVTVSSSATGIAAIAPRSTMTTYDTKGQFPITVANALGHTESKTFDPRFGTVATLTGPNNLTTTWQYDGFGRKTNETRADGTQTVWTYAACDAACPAYGIYRIVTQVFAPGGVQSAPVSVAYFDRLNREVRTATQSFDGRWVYKDTQYDGQGRVAKASRPYFAGGAVYWATSNYDDLGRVTQAFEPDEPGTAALTVVYNGLTVTRTNRKAQTTVEIKNSQGQTVSVTDALAKTTTYTYDPFGNPFYILNPGGTLVSLTTYDIRGRKTTGYSPDMGGWTYDYDALGELVKQTDAKGQIATFVYDQLGRMTSRAEPGLTSTWVWDTAYTAGKGKLFEATTSAGYSRTHYYDDKGRPFLTLVNPGDGAFLWSSTAFDAAGRVYEQHYPSGVSVRHIYNALGYAAELRNATTNALYWKLDAQDAEGHITQETYGNGVVTARSYQADNGRLQTIVANPAAGPQVQGAGYFYDTLGNIWLRGDDTGAEFPTYDDLNRLTGITRYDPNGNTVETIVYDAKGNIVSKTGIGDYHYGGDPACAAGNGAGPHAVCQAVCQAGGNAYSYDANGNLIAGGGRIVGWTAWNMPGGLIQGGQTTTWLYGPEHDRYKMVTAGRTTWYLNPGLYQGGHYERTQYANGTVEHRTTLYGAGRPIGEVLSFDGTAPEQTRYFHTDHQGSITVVTDSTGAVITRYRYDPWGKQVLVAGSNTGINATRQGHTAHEMLDGGLTHMNGRLYDPVLSRFVSADPTVDNPFDLQSLNRYSYVNNNPMGFTDPTGYFKIFGMKWSSFRDKVVKPVAAIAVAWVVGPMAYNFGYWGVGGAALGAGASAGAATFIGGVAGGALAGAAVGGITGGIYNGPQGIVQGARYGAIGGAITGPVAAFYGDSPWGAERLAAQSVSGGLSSAAQGGSFVDGFRFSGITSLASYGMDAAGRATDRLKSLACNSGGSPCFYDERGQLRTDGARDIDWSLNPSRQGNWLTDTGMAREASGQHWYDPGGPLDNQYLRHFVSDVSKMHDWYNSWSYNSANGFYMSRGTGFDSVFQIYSFAGMPVAGALTAVGYLSDVPYNRYVLDAASGRSR